MEDTVHNSQPSWVGNDPEPMHSSEKRVLALEEQVFTLQSQISTLQNKNNLMRASRNNFLKEKTLLKEHNTALADMIANLNSYITQLQISALTTSAFNATSTLVTTNSYCKQKIPDPLLFTGN